MTLFPNCEPLFDRVRSIHDSGIALTVMASGGAVEAVSKLTAIPGASKVFQEAIIPYAGDSMTCHAGQVSPSVFQGGVKVSGGSVTEEVAISMAHAAWIRSSELDRTRPAFGLGITAALQSLKSHRAGDRAWIAVQSGISGQHVYTAQIGFVPEGRININREAQSLILGATALWMLADHIKKPAPLNHDSEWYSWLARVRNQMTYEIGAQRPICPTWPSLRGDAKGTVFGKDGTVHRAEYFLDREKHYILGGRFAPAHWGHFAAKRYLDRTTKKVGVFNATRQHPRKGRLSDEAVFALLQACKGKVDVLVDEDSQLFIDKARRWGCDIAMGLDAFNLMAAMNRADVERCGQAGSVLHVCARPGSIVDWKQMGGAISTGFVRYYVDAGWPVSSTEIRAHEGTKD